MHVHNQRVYVNTIQLTWAAGYHSINRVSNPIYVVEKVWEGYSICYVIYPRTHFDYGHACIYFIVLPLCLNYNLSRSNDC